MRNLPHLPLLIDLLSDRPDLSVLADPDKWDVIQANCGPEGLGPVVAFTARGHVGPAERAWCDQVLKRSWSLHNRNVRQLDYVSGILAEHGISALSLKGPLLALKHYQPPFLRKSSIDLDLAVREADVERACRALSAAGYSLRGRMRDWMAIGHHVQLTHGSRPSLELHFRLSHGALGIPVAEFFDRALISRLPTGREMAVLGNADEFLHLVLHCAHARYTPLFYLYEVRKILRAAPVGLVEEAVARAAAHKFTGAFAMMEIALRSRWGESLLPAGAALRPTWLHWRVNEKLFDAFENGSGPEDDITLRSRFAGRWLEFQMTDRASEALRFVRFMARVAWFHLRNRGWRRMRKYQTPAIAVKATKVG